MGTVQMIILALTGLFLVFIGLSRFINPIVNYAKNSGVVFPNEVNVLNEVKGVSVLMIGAGLLIVLGAVLSSFGFTAFVIGCLIFWGFAIGRLLSWAIDGRPNKKIVQGIAFEFIFGLAHLWGLFTQLG